LAWTACFALAPAATGQGNLGDPADAAASGVHGQVSETQYGTANFPCPEDLRARVEFWVRIFGHYGGDQKVIHDQRYPWIVYEVVEADGMSREEFSDRVDQRMEFYGDVLEQLALKTPERYTAEEARIAVLFEHAPELARFTRARERIRSQTGVRDQMRASLARSGRYREHILELFESMGVPAEVACLPHVESSFNPSARSKVGALGLWQFTSDTGKNFMRVENDLDERLDPFRASEAAGAYLKRSLDVLGTWPLAIVSYNHGLSGVLRAKNQLGTTDIERILQEYDGPSFGFASQNFYCEFLAVVEIASNPEKYFGDLAVDPPLVHDEYELPQWVRFGSLLDAFSVTRSELIDLNPALGASYLQGSRALPRGYRLRLPAGRVENPQVAFASLPEAERFDQSPRPPGYRVQRGDTLAQIAKRHRISLSQLRAMNNLGRSDHIKIGQVLVLPDAAFPAAR